MQKYANEWQKHKDFEFMQIRQPSLWLNEYILGEIYVMVTILLLVSILTIWNAKKVKFQGHLYLLSVMVAMFDMQIRQNYTFWRKTDCVSS